MTKIVKLTKKNLMEMINTAITTQMTDMGDSKLSPEAHMFLYRGIAPQDLKDTINGIIVNLKSGGVKFTDNEETLAAEITQAIHKIIRNSSNNI